ncbi:methyltransferase domain-containing protein [Pseudomonadota bacterium]
MTKRFLNLGCGHRRHPDWVNIDVGEGFAGVISHDLRNGIPFPDKSFDVVYHSHVLEHIAKHEAPLFLKECHRVLKDDGIFRIVVPDMELLARNYLERLEEVRMRNDGECVNFEWSTIHFLDQMVRTSSGGEMARFLKERDELDLDYIKKTCGPEVVEIAVTERDRNPTDEAKLNKNHTPKTKLSRLRFAFQRILFGKSFNKEQEIAKFRNTGEVHQWMYDEISLATLLSECGFKNPSRKIATDSAIENWCSFHLDTRDDGTIFHTDSLYMEAYR